MTTTLPPPPPAVAAEPLPPEPPSRPPAPARRPRRAVPQLHLVLAEVSLAALTTAAVVGFGRIFQDWSFLAPLLVIALLTHATIAVCGAWASASPSPSSSSPSSGAWR